ncbi:MAG: DUF4465 domain-containing protein [Armatimonadetes bacterium]|nr:DUF4465 domain-containing protein [Armatimonadota bacterium]
MKTHITLAALALSGASFANLATFDDLSLAPGSYENTASFASDGFGFNNSYDPTFGSWAAFAYSSVQDGTTAGFGNQYAAKPGAAHSGANYGVAFQDSFTPVTPTITVPTGQSLTGLWITNTTYAYYSMHDGDAFAKKFGGATGNDPDWFKVTATGLVGLTITGTADFFLADFRDADNSNDYIVSDWRYFDLTGLGAATSVQFTLSSSDNGAFGMNTPAYFAIDDVSSVPEPASLAIIGFGLVGLARRRSRRA